MTARLVIPFAIGDMRAGEYEIFGVEQCGSLDCGEQRPVEYLDGAYRCLACGAMWDPSEASC